MSTYAAEILRITQKLAAARAKDLSCFGSKTHHFVLNPVTTETDLASVESDSGISVPNELRQFLLLAGNGGAGPYYGLVPFTHRNLSLYSPPPQELSRPCLLKPESRPLSTGLLPAPWTGPVLGEGDVPFQGTLYIGSQGCSYSMLIVLTGQHRGRIVYVDEDLAGQPYFVHDSGFLAWYERWLDELLAGLDTAWFGFGLLGSEAELRRALEDSDSSAHDKAEAIQSLRRIHAPSDSTIAAISAIKDNPTSPLRQHAMQILARYAARNADPMLALLLHGTGTERKVALEAIADARPPGWHNSARALLDDPDPKVIVAAANALARHNLLERADLVLLLSSPHLAVQRHALWNCRRFQHLPIPITIPDAMLADADPSTRRAAIAALSRQQIRQSLTAIIASTQREPDVAILTSLIDALARSADPGALTTLKTLRSDQRRPVRVHAARALASLRQDRPHFLRRLGSWLAQ